MKKFYVIILLFLCLILPAQAKKIQNNENHTQNTLLYLNLDWWQYFQDDILNQHLKTLYESNYDIKNAELKIKENEKLVKMQMANELPFVSFDGFISRDLQSSVQRFGDMVIPNYSQNNFQLPLTAGYEIDLWGKNRLKTKMANEQLFIANQAERAVYISLTSNFTAEYFNLIKADKLINIQDEIINIQKDILSKTEDKYKIGLCSTDNVLNEKKLLSSFIEEKNKLEENKEIILNVLRVYLSKPEEEIERKSYEDIILLSDIPEEINTNIIENRPDYIISESNLRKTGYDVRVAKKELLPNFIIFGQIGVNAYRINSLFNKTSQLANAGIMPSFDLFSGGRKLAFLQFKKYQYEEAINNYHKTILDDIKEVNLGLFSYKTALKNFEQSEERLKTEHELYNLNLEKQKIGAASILDNLYSRQADLIVQKEEVSNKIDCLISVISLYKAVGGKNLFEINENI